MAQGGLFNFGVDDLDPDAQGLFANLPPPDDQSAAGPTIEAAPKPDVSDLKPTDAPAPTLDKGPNWWQRLNAPDAQGVTLGEKLQVAGAYAQGNPDAAMNFQQNLYQRNQTAKAQAASQAMQEALFSSMDPKTGKLDRNAFQQKLAGLKTPVDLGTAAQAETAFGPDEDLQTVGGDLYAGDKRDPSSWRMVVRGERKAQAVPGGYLLPKGPTGVVGPGAAGQQPSFQPTGVGAGGAAGGGATPPGQAPLTGAALGPSQAQPAPRGPLPATPNDEDALTRMLATEALGEGNRGMAAVGNVALNRLAQGWNGAKTLSDVIYAPKQFTGMSRAGQVSDADYAKANVVAKQLLAGQLPDETGGAVNYLNPQLQAQNGAPQPDWAPSGQGQRIGRHVFYGGNPQAAAAATPGQKTAADAVAAAAPALQGGTGSDTLPDGTPVPEGYEFHATKPTPEWEDLPPDQAHALGALAGQRNVSTREIKLYGEGKAPGVGPKKPPAAGVMQQLGNHAEALQISSSINSRLQNVTDQLNSGKLDLGLGQGALAAIQNQGIPGIPSTEQSRNYASFQAQLEKMRNDSLRLNKGVQTEGDAQRAWNELVSNIHDPNVVKQRLAEIQDLNNQAIAFHKDAYNQIREDAGMEPVDPSKFMATALPSRSGAGTPGTGGSRATPQQAQLAGAAQQAQGAGPPASRLTEGVVTHFGNGQSWTKRQGRVMRVG